MTNETASFKTTSFEQGPVKKYFVHFVASLPNTTGLTKE
ncbi:hypothetical protein C942_02426 [Photobacterium marinum]|uniref:Uncharacterized protein n=1 Tax=Photobacterium marinum TaxID=1056511 RepID=L8J8S9_9GAMM|nr:hypothetical protein C942_02426 [Photobacterium marinum]